MLAWHLAGAGERTVVVERRWVGGSCPNVNCLPAKNEIWSAKVADLIRHASQFGVTTGRVSVDIAGRTRAKTRNGPSSDQNPSRQVQSRRRQNW